MDAVTSIELEARRRQEIFEREATSTRLLRAVTVAHAETASDQFAASRVIGPRANRAAERRSAAGDCQPAPLARQSVG